MPLSFEEKAKLGKLYERNRLWRKYRWSGVAMFPFVPSFAFLARDFFKDLHAPVTTHDMRAFCLEAFFAGIVVAAVVVQTVILAQWRKRDNETLDFMEKHFPEDCPWKEEEEVLRKAEELDREARASNIVAAAIRPGA